MDHLKFIQDLHDKEFQTKESLAQRANMIITGMTTLAGIVAFVIVNFTSLGHFIDILFWFLIITSGILLTLTASYLIWSFRVPQLLEIGRPKDWLSYWNDLQEQAQKGEITSAEKEFTDYLISQYAEVGENNIDSNFKRGVRLVKSNSYLLASFVFVMMAALTFYYNNYIFQGKTRQGGGYEMFTEKEALICIPADNVINASTGQKPKPRPVPIPGPEGPEPGD